MSNNKESYITTGTENIAEFADRINYLCTEFSNKVKTNRNSIKHSGIFKLVVTNVDNTKEKLSTPLAIFYKNKEKNNLEIIGTNNDYLIYYISKNGSTTVLCIQFLELSKNKDIHLSDYTINKIQRFYLLANGDIELEYL